MRSIGSFQLEPEAALDLLAALDRETGVDAFLAPEPHGCLQTCHDSTPGVGVCLPNFLAGIGPNDEFSVSDATPPEQMASFAFADERPTFGWLPYEWGLARLGVKSPKERTLPRGCLRKYGLYLSYAPGERRLDLLHPGAPDPSMTERVARLAAGGVSPWPPRAPARFADLVAHSMERAAYERGVESVLEHIRAGDTYQLNLSIEFSAPTRECDPFALWRLFFRRHPAAHYAFFRHGAHALLCTSPERFLRVRDGEVLSQPIKGTLRCSHEKAPQELVDALKSSPKEDAELSMIVDLVRNDISGACDYGSVRVSAHKSVFQVDDLLQMHSDVTGTLRPGRHVFDLLAGAFPPGSVTGCPKKRSLQIIDRIEPHTRDIYCGAFLMVMGPRDMDSCVAIRTARHEATGENGEGRLVFNAGSGIVLDSNPSREYQETLAKAGKFLRVVEELQ